MKRLLDIEYRLADCVDMHMPLRLKPRGLREEVPGFQGSKYSSTESQNRVRTKCFLGMWHKGGHRR